MVDESAQPIAVITSNLSVFSWLWVKVDANCVVASSNLESGESFTVSSKGVSMGHNTQDKHYERLCSISYVLRLSRMRVGYSNRRSPKSSGQERYKRTYSRTPSYI